jgi:proline iminopeptidase
VEPDAHGLLDVGDGNRVYWESCGDPAGVPAVLLHGGPGQGCTAGMRRTFASGKFRGVLYDQRGCGRSTPHASDPATDMSVNTTDHLVRDMERLREHLGIDRWVVTGGSWGSTLALAYAELHPQRVRAIVLLAVTTTRRAEIDWLYRGVARFYPEAWERFRDAVPPGERSGDLVAAYARLLEHPDAAVRLRAANAWCAWEDAVLSLETGGERCHAAASERDRLAFVRICSHYFAHGAWLGEDAILRGAPRLAGIPATLIHGRRDHGSPIETAWLLARAWPGARFVAIESAGHVASDETRAALVAALDRAASA